MKILKTSLTIMLFFWAFTVQSQENAWSVQLSAGPTIHYGDIMDHKLFFPALDNSDAWNFSGSLSLEKRFTPIFSLRGQVLYGKLGGTRQIYNRYFKADLFDYSLQARIDFVDIFSDENPYRTFNIYGLIGAGMSNWESTLMDYTTDDVLRKSGGVDVGMLKMTTEGFIPVGLGTSIRLGDNIHLNIEETLRITNSDMLDASEGGSKYDMYSFTSVGLSFSFGGKQSTRGRTTPVTHRIDDQNDTPSQQNQDNNQQSTETQAAPFTATIDSEMPDEINAGQNFAVNLTINKGELSGAATIRQVFPEGFEVQPLALEGGDYNFMSQVFTVNWNEMPANKVLSLTYRVKTNNVDGGSYPISGIFTYTQDANSKLLPFKNTVKVNAPTQVAQEDETSYESEGQMNQGVVFRVQIRAKYRNKMSTAALKSRYNLDETIYEDYHNGYFIYTLGNYSSYEEARRKRERITINNGISDAFVVAFKNGERVDKLSNLKRF